MGTLFQQHCEFIAGAASVESLPPVTRPEVALIGRSNAGKSSLVNALTGRKSLARTSQNPGATKQLNFFDIGSRLVLVDMPGYGFARTSKAEAEEWKHLIRSYLVGRPTLRRVCLLVDARRGLLPADIEFMELLDEVAVTYQIILTKADTLKEADLSLVLQSLQKKIQSHPAAHPDPIVTSAVDKRGIEYLQEELLAFAATE